MLALLLFTGKSDTCLLIWHSHSCVNKLLPCLMRCNQGLLREVVSNPLKDRTLTSTTPQTKALSSLPQHCQRAVDTQRDAVHNQGVTLILLITQGSINLDLLGLRNLNLLMLLWLKQCSMTSSCSDSG